MAVFLSLFGIEVSTLVLDSCPSVLSLGRLVEEHGMDFCWRSGHRPSLSKGGQTVKLEVVDFVSCLNMNCIGKVFALPGVAAPEAAALDAAALEAAAPVVAAPEAAAAEAEPDSDDEPAVNFGNCDKLTMSLAHQYSHLPRPRTARSAESRRPGGKERELLDQACVSALRSTVTL